MTVTFVTAIFNINLVRSNEIWDRFTLLCKIIPIVIVCSASDRDKIPEGATPIFREFYELETVKMLNKYNKLPKVRNEWKDTKEYMLLMNSKTECVQLAKDKVEADHYIWIDAGISKIFKNPIEKFESILETTSKPLNDTQILISGCWPHKETNFAKLVERIHWRFCGGFFVVPANLVEPFFLAVLNGCKEIGETTEYLTWEVNIWSFIEATLPIQWEKGDHNDSISDCLGNYLIN